LTFYPEEGSSTFLRNFGIEPRKYGPDKSPSSVLEISQKIQMRRFSASWTTY